MLKVVNFQKNIKESIDNVSTYTNKFKFIIGKIYEYEELPKQIQNDIDIQFDESNYEESPYDYKWKFKLMNPKDTEEYLVNFFGHDLDNAINSKYMQKLIKNIKKRGIDWPAVGNEGNHRALACWQLRIPLPYLDPIYKY